MGWQLVPTGIGWRAFNKTLKEGRFDCDNPRCNGRVEATQPYRMRRSKNWFTVLFIPIIPLNVKGVYVECRACKSIFHVSVLTSGDARSIDTTAKEVITSSVISPPPLPQAALEALEPAPLIAGAPPAPLPQHRARLLMDNGSSIEIAGSAIVGRAPTVRAPFEHATVHGVEDPTRTMSKTHAAFVVDAGGVWVHDLGAANGVIVAAPGIEPIKLGDEPMLIPAGATVHLGEQAVQVARAT